MHFSWRGRGNHYVKTTEELAHYAFRFPLAFPALRVRFELVRAREEENNVKGRARYFVALPGEARTVDAGADGLPEFIIPFEFRPLEEKEERRLRKAKEDAEADTVQQALLEEALPALEKAAPPALLRAKDGMDALAAHLRRYARKNRTDYFVHPDLGGFLGTELDYFLKNEVLDVAALLKGERSAGTLGDRLVKLRVIRSVAEEVIALLHQVEDVQARLFEKRKMVLRADYLAPVFAVPEALHAEIVAEPRQRKEWAELFGVELGPDDGEELKRRPTLIVNTAHFGADLKERLLASFDDLEAAIDGVLVHSENYAALRTVGTVYQGSTKCVYLDPPYNTGSDEFLYKDDFSRHSTWLTMMEERLRLGRDLLTADGFAVLSIDDVEVSRLTLLLGSVYGDDSAVAVTAWDRNRKNDAKLFSVGHEYMLVHARDRARLKQDQVRLREEKRGVREARGWFAEARERLGPDETALRADWKEWVRTFPDADARKRLRRYTKVDATRGPFRDDKDISWPGGGGPTYEVLHPETERPVKLPSRGWVYPDEETFWQRYHQGHVRFGADETVVPAVVTYLFESDTEVLPSVFYSYAQSATQEFDNLWGKKGVFPNPKNWRDIARMVAYLASDRDTIVDYFAGSGTTGHSVVALNRTDGGKRRFLLVDQGQYFDSVLIPRILKVIHTESWKDGRPAAEVRLMDGEPLPAWVRRSPKLVQVLRLESYEGTLNAMETPVERSARLQGQEELFGDRYLLRYFLPLETADSAPLLNLRALEDPFAYRLRVHTPEGSDEHPVDLVETFPLVMGLRPTHRWTAAHPNAMAGADRRYTLMEARQRDGRLVLVVWRPVAELDAKAEKEWLTTQLSARERTWANYARVWMNSTGALPRGEELDEAFRRALLERDPYVVRSFRGAGASPGFDADVLNA